MSRLVWSGLVWSGPNCPARACREPCLTQGGGGVGEGADRQLRSLGVRVCDETRAHGELSALEECVCVCACALLCALSSLLFLLLPLSLAAALLAPPRACLCVCACVRITAAWLGSGGRAEWRESENNVSERVSGAGQRQRACGPRAGCCRLVALLR